MTRRSPSGIAWPLLYALLAACLLGLFGQGPLSRTDVRSADGRLQIGYERFLRRESDDSIDFTLRPTGQSARLHLSSAWVRKVDIDHVFPEPEQRVSGADAVTLVFATHAQQPVIVTDMELRRFVRKMVELEFSNLAVLSYQELTPELNIQPIGRISMRAVNNDFASFENEFAELPDGLLPSPLEQLSN